MIRVIIVLFAFCALGQCQDRFDYLDEIGREVRSENSEITTEDLETIVKRAFSDELKQEMKKTREEYKKKVAACGLANNFLPYKNCIACKKACKETEACRSGQCRKICKADKEVLKSKSCDLSVDKTALNALWKQAGYTGEWKGKHGFKTHRGKGHNKHLDDA